MSNKSSAKARRTAARLAAAQALYQLELGAASTAEAVYDLLQMHQDDMPEELITPDADLLKKITDAAYERLPDIDALVNGQMGESRSLERAEAVLRAVLRAGTCELLIDGETPAGIIINDYVNVAHAFFLAAEPSKVNAVLNAVAKSLGRAGDSTALTAGM